MVAVALGPSCNTVLNKPLSAKFREKYASWVEFPYFDYRAEFNALVIGPKSARVKFSSAVPVWFCAVAPPV